MRYPQSGHLSVVTKTGRYRPISVSRAYEASVCFSVFLLTTALSENRSSLGLLGAYIVTFTTLWDD